MTFHVPDSTRGQMYCNNGDTSFTVTPVYHCETLSADSNCFLTKLMKIKLVNKSAASFE